MAQRTESRAAKSKKVGHSKKDKLSVKRARVVAAKSRAGGKAEYADNKSRSVEAKAPKTKPNRSRSGPAAKTKMPQSKGAPREIKAVKGKSTMSRPGGEAKARRHVSQPGASRAKSKSKIKKKRASVEMKGAKSKSTPSRPGAAKSAPHVGLPAMSRAKSKSKTESKERASVEVKKAKGKTAPAHSGRKAKAAPKAGQRSKSRATVKVKKGKEKSASGGSIEAKVGATVPRPRRKARPAPRYLAAELGQPVDHDGEPIGAGSALLDSDAEMQAYAFQLWRQMQSGGGAKRYIRAIERAGFTVDEVWTVGITDIRTTSSTPDELRRYQQKLLFRANLLEAILSESVAELHRLLGIEATPSANEAIASGAGPALSDKVS